MSADTPVPKEESTGRFLIRWGVILLIATLTAISLSNCRMTISWERPKSAEVKQS
jgi:hypothetical protein